MCLHPITLNAPSWYHSKECQAYRLFNPAYYRRLYPDVLTVPCGKCVECLKKRQSDYLQVFYLLAKRYGSMHFVTLTYDNNHIPVAVREELPQQPDKFGCPSLSPPVFDHPFAHELRDLYFSRYRKGLYSPQVIEFNGSSYQVTPSVFRRDPRLWLKRCRVAWKYKNRESLPDFHYSLVPEYGIKTGRPHYHILFFGLDDEHLKFMLSQWKAGFTFLETIPVSSNDDSRAAVSNYVGKYVTKGIFEPIYLRRGSDGLYNCEPPRVCSSRNLVQLDEKQENYYNLSDLDYTFFYLPDYDISDRLIARQHIHIGKFDYKLGRHLIDYLYKFKLYNYELQTVFFVPNFTPIYDEQGYLLSVVESAIPSGSRVKRLPDGTVYKEIIRTVTKTRSISLYKDLQDRLQVLHDLRDYNKLEELRRISPNSDIFEISEQFYEAEKLALGTRLSRSYESLKSFYSRSNF